MPVMLRRARTATRRNAGRGREEQRVRRRVVVGPVVAPLLLASLSGCYNYEPVARLELVPQTFLQVTLTDLGTDTLTRYLGPDVRLVRGRVLRGGIEQVVLSVASVENRRGANFSWQGETVVVPGEFVRGLEARHPARAKSALLTLVSIAGFVITYTAFGPGAGGTTPSGGGRGPASH